MLLCSTAPHKQSWTLEEQKLQHVTKTATTVRVVVVECETKYNFEIYFYCSPSRLSFINFLI